MTISRSGTPERDRRNGRDDAAFDVAQVRLDFPILERTVRGRPLVYLDNAATTQKPRQVIDALVHYYEGYNANIHRGLHTLAEEATAAYEDARARVARFIGAPGPECIVFTRNTTESINLVAQAWGRAHLRPGDEIVITAMEHHSDIIPWQLIARDTGARIEVIPIDDEGELVWDEAERKIGPRTRVVAAAHMSNVLGTINDVARLARLAHGAGAILVVDGAQSVPHMPVDVQELDCDFLAFSAHKMLGPTGVGALYGRRELLESMEPFLGGGEMIRRVDYTTATWNDIPWKFEAGTPNIADVIAFGAAIDYLEGLGMGAVRAHEMDLTAYALGRLGELEGITVYGPKDPARRGGVVAFNFGDIHPHDLGQILDGYGVAVRAGHHCAQPLMRRLGVVATARASFYVYNTREEIDVLVEGIRASLNVFGHAVRT
jgi:cysteine desulfurase/selenocysteine lyase